MSHPLFHSDSGPDPDSHINPSHYIFSHHPSHSFSSSSTTATAPIIKTTSNSNLSVAPSSAPPAPRPLSPISVSRLETDSDDTRDVILQVDSPITDPKKPTYHFKSDPSPGHTNQTIELLPTATSFPTTTTATSPPSSSSACSSSCQLSITIRTLTGKTVPVLISSSSTVYQLKEHLESLSSIGVSPHNQMLIYGGRELKDEWIVGKKKRERKGEKEGEEDEEGRYKEDDKFTREECGIENGSVVHIALRTNKIEGVGNRASPGGQEGFQPEEGEGIIYLPPPGSSLNLNHSRIAYQPVRVAPSSQPASPSPPPSVLSSLDVNRSALSIRLFGFFFILVGAINAVAGGATASWAELILGVLLLLLGILAVRTGMKKTTSWAKIYLISICFFMLAFGGILIGNSLIADMSSSSSSSSSSNSESGSGGSSGLSGTSIGLIVVLGVLVPLLGCGFCAYCARIHYQHCKRRDELTRTMEAAAAQPQYPLRIQLVGELPGEGEGGAEHRNRAGSGIAAQPRAFHLDRPATATSASS